MKDRIKELRKSTGLTQEKFAQLVGMPVSTLHNWEQGKTKAPEWVINLVEFYVTNKK